MTKDNTGADQQPTSRPNGTRPLFICYRQIDGKRYGRWLCDLLQKSADQRTEKVVIYFDQTTKAGNDWKNVHGASLESAHTMLVICTPGLYSDQGPEDWAHRELDWWIQHRTIAPVIIDVTGEGTRWIPQKLKDRWPHAQRVILDKDLWENAKQEERDLAASQVVGQILGSRTENEFIVIQQDLEKTRRTNSRMRLALILMCLFAISALVAMVVAIRATSREEVAKNLAITKSKEATEAQIEATKKRIQAQTSTRIAKESEERAVESEHQAKELLQIAITGMADGLVQEGFRRREDEPEVALRLAELASRLTESTRPAELLRSSLVAAPVWCRIGAKSHLPIEQAFMPPQPRLSDPFATDKDIDFVLGPAASDSYPSKPLETELFGGVDDFTIASSVVVEPPSLDWNSVEKTVLALRRVPDGKAVATLQLEKKEWLLAPNPSATDLICTRTGEGEGWKGRVFELTPKGLEAPVFEFTDAKDFCLTNGSWPCYVLYSDGKVKQFNSPVNTRELGRWDASGLSAHPSGNAIALLTEEAVVWVGTSKAEPEIITLPWNGSRFTASGIRSACTLRWGPEPHHILVYRLDGDRVGDKLQAKTVLSAINVRTKKTQTITEHIIRANALTRLICETDGLGHRVAVTAFEQSSAKKIIETAGGKVEVITLRWNDDASDSVVDALREPDGLLRGKRLPATKVSVRCASFAPNGNFIVVANDLRTSSGTGNGTGLVESWNLSPLDYEGSDTTDARMLPFGVSSVVRLAYSSDSSRVAIWDHAGVTHLYRIATEPPGLFDSHRLPKEVLERFAVREVDTYGPRNRFWLADYGGGDVRVYDLAMKQLDSQISGLSSHDVLDLTWCDNDQSLRIVTRETVLTLKDGQLKEEYRFPERAISANAGGDAICVLTDDRLYMFDRNTMKIIAEASRTELPMTFNDLLPHLVRRHTGNRSSQSICKWFKDTVGALSVCFKKNGEVLTYELTTNNGEFVTVKTVSKIELDKTSKWHSIRRTPSGKYIVILEGDNSGAASMFRQVDAATGADIELYPAPTNGWPGKLMEIVDVANVSENRIAILFRYYYSKPKDPSVPFDIKRAMDDLKQSYQGFFIGVWAADGGKCIEEYDFGRIHEMKHAEFAYIDWQNPVSESHLMISGSRKAVFVRANDALAQWSSEIPTELLEIPPYLAPADDQGWTVPSVSGYEKTIQRILMGGGDQIGKLTAIQLPAEREEKVVRLEQFRVQLQKKR